MAVSLWETIFNPGKIHQYVEEMNAADAEAERRSRMTPSQIEQQQKNEPSKTAKKIVKEWSEMKPTASQLQFNRKAAGLTPTEAVKPLALESTLQVKVNPKGTGLVLSGSKETLKSDMAKQLRSFLKENFQYADLKSTNVTNAISKLNEDIYSQMESRVAESLLGVSYDDYKEHKNTMQQFEGTNPLKSTGAVPGYTRDGRKIKATDEGKKTVSQWLEYYQKNYSPRERANLYNASREAIANGSNDFALWTPYLVMSGGNISNLSSSPVYGFSTGDRIAAGVEALLNEGSARLIEGINQAGLRAAQVLTNLKGYDMREGLNKTLVAFGLNKKGESVKSEELPWLSEEQFNKKLEGLEGQRFNRIPNDVRRMILAAAQDEIHGKDRDYIMKEFLSDGVITSDVLSKLSYKKYIDERDNISTIEQYDKEMNKRSEQLSSGREWLQKDIDAATLCAPLDVTLGSFAGTLMRMWAESGLIAGATGGAIVPTAISDSIAGSTLGLVQKIAPASGALKALQTPVGQFLLSVVAELPEDVVQTVIDDVMTNRAGDIASLAPTGDLGKDMEKLGGSFAQNLAFRLAFTPIHSGIKTAQNWSNARKAARAAGSEAVTHMFDASADNSMKLRSALDDGTSNVINVTADSATLVHPDGTEEVLDNVAMLHFGDAEMKERYPAVAEMLRKNGLIEDIEEADFDQKIDAARKAVENGDYTDVTTGIIKKGITYDADGDLVDLAGNKVKLPEADADSTVLYRGQPITEDGSLDYNDAASVKKSTEGAFYLIDSPTYAATFGDSLVYFSPKNADILDFDSYTSLKEEAQRLANDFNAMVEYARVEGIEKSDMMRRLADGDVRAAAELTGKPVVASALKAGGDIEHIYYTGINEDFDKAVSVQTLASITPESPEASRANYNMGERAQYALDTKPYDKTIEEIVAEKYAKNADTISDAPSSASYKWESPDVTKTYNTSEEVFADMPTGKNMTEVRQWMKNAEAFFMDRYTKTLVPEFNAKYPTVEEQQQFVRNMDYLFDQQRLKGETVESAIGKTYENEGIVYTVKKEDVDFYKNSVEPLMADLRTAGAVGQGKEAFTITGYLPHSDYDPTVLTAEDSMQQGVLWRQYTGASTTAEDGNFSTGWLNPDLETRYRTFANNMLWDSLGDEIIVAKYMDEFNADGLNVRAEAAEKMVGGRRRLADIVSKSDSAKSVIKAITGSGDMPTDTDVEETAKKIGATDAIHGIYQEIYGQSAGLNQRRSVSLMSKADWMHSLTTGDGSLYDNGGAMIVNSNADAKFMAKRIFEDFEEGDTSGVRQMFVDYLTQNNRRTAKGAGYIADKWMDKIAQKSKNGLTRRALTAELGRLVYNEGSNRVFRFIGRMDVDKLNSSNKKALDSLLFRHSMLSKVMNTSGFTAKLNSATNKLISARMKSLFWLNFKNGVLQTSECVRLFTEFKLGDALETIRRLATDKEFRAEADEWVDMLVPERFVKSDNAAPIEALGKIADKTTSKNGAITVEKMSSSELKDMAKKFDDFASKPVEMGESVKNRVIMAGILQEAHRKGLSGNELFSFVNQRFERIGLAANEMGRLNAADSPLFRIATNLKQFQIREVNMWLNNITDMNGASEKVTYILKNLGWKAGLTLIMAKLGYSATATLGIDPFDLMDDDYNGVDEENYNALDTFMVSPTAKLLLSGGFTGYISDLYWASRKAYEDNSEVTEETERVLDENRNPFAEFAGLSWEDAVDAFTGFIPGYTSGKRVIQMNELMDTGWATSATGNKMYAAPTSPADVATGYLFGRSNTPQARTYYQTPDYLQGLMSGGVQGLGQQIGREFGGYRQFDPIDKENYSDWFDGSSADEQQWQSGYYYFRNRMRDIQDKYQDSLSGYVTDEQKTALRDSYNEQMTKIEEQLNKFTSAYEAKHPEGINSAKMKNLINVLNTYQPVMGETEEEDTARSMNAYNDALSRYTNANLPDVVSYKRDEKTGKVEEVYSPQLRAAIQGNYGLPKEAAAQIRQLYNSKWKELGQKYRTKMFNTKGSKAKQAIQREYISIVRKDLDPIVRLYGNNIWGNEDVENIIDDVFNSMIPKYGQSAKSYLKQAYKGYSGILDYTEKGSDTMKEINKLLDQGKTARAKALARTLLQRVQENRAAVGRTELEKLRSIVND